ncbi:Restriction endonuclease type II-like [Moorella glycerini]|uniref:DNA 3'-5' helicase n=1 Tax=Neomoorella stamsii TaxID=1266720 RepID=A0A9X7P773_9FIRM|nr:MULTISPECIES: ATP-dependent DNA helicase [Moorella]PRR76302.1 ATP-dependent DNA helicase PcrA [Moorella stamsii]CEP67130.1 Restriction endonuclease type II-like [Moorella glycerini]
MALKYTDAQILAINHRKGNLQIIACAGSGKTEVISRRIAQIVKEGTPRSCIVAFTFTDRAAMEMKARIRKHLEELCPEDPSLGDMYVGTIHSFCFQLLKEIDPIYRNYEILDEIRQAALISSKWNKQGLWLERCKRLVRSGKYWDTVRGLINTLNVLHIKNIPDDQIADDVARDVIERYRRLTLEKPNYFLDFNGIIGELIKTLRANPEKLMEVRQRFKYVVADEYQDFDPRQEELLYLITDGGKSASVCVVGDDDQAIYGWRGADITNMLEFEKRYPDVTRINMIYNFRSTHAIVEIANASVRPLRRRLPKAMEARHWDFEVDPENPVETIAERGDIQRRCFATEREEAEYVADRIKVLRGMIIKEKDGTERAIDYADMAILLRSVKSAGREFVDVLREQGIPVVVRGTRGLFSHDEIRLVQAAFCQLAQEEFWYEDNDGNEHHLTIDSTRDFIRQTIRNLRSKGAMPSADPNVFLQWIAEKRATIAKQKLPREKRGRVSRRIYPQDWFHEMLRVLGASDGPEPWPEDVLYNLGRFSYLISQFESVHQWITPDDLVPLCRFLNGWAASNTDDGGQDEISVPNAVQVMTIHAAKGLEWPVVFIPRVTTHHFPNTYLKSRGPETFLSPEQFDPKEFAGGDDGERRLWYVAVTRSRKFLHITSLDRKHKRPQIFMTEIRHDYVQDDGTDPSEPRPRGVPTPPVDTEILPTTYSDLNYYWGCPFDYQLRRLMGFRPGVKEAYGYGLQVHNLLAAIHERALKGEEISAEWIHNIVQERFNLRYTNQDVLETLRAAAEKTLRRYVSIFPEQAKYVFRAEQPFEFIEGDALISGTIDLLEKVETNADGSELRVPVGVVDFKTGTGEDYKDYLQRVKNVERQLRLYAVAVRRALNLDPHHATAYFLGPNPPEDLRIKEQHQVDISDASREVVMMDVARAVAGIKAHEFPLRGRETGRCRGCDFYRICPAGPHKKHN